MGKKQIENERTSSSGGDFYFLPREIPVAGVGATAKVLPDGGETSTESTREDVVAGEKDVFVEIEVSKSIRGHSLQGLGQEEQQQKQQKRDSGDATKDEFGPKPVNRNLVPGQLSERNRSGRNIPYTKPDYEQDITSTDESSGSSVRSTSSMRIAVIKDGTDDQNRRRTMTPNPFSRALFNMFGGNKPVVVDPAKAKKVNPKLFFSLERTFLAWMHAAILVAGISFAVSVVPPSSIDGLMISLFFTGAAVVVTVYALMQYAKRSLMLVRRSPGPYEDRWGPVVVGSIFVLSLVAQFCIFIAASVHSNKLS